MPNSKKPANRKLKRLRNNAVRCLMVLAITLASLLLPSATLVAQATEGGHLAPTFEGNNGPFQLLNQAAPLGPFLFTDEDGRRIRFSDITGRLLLVNLWGTWCPPCVTELPSLDRLQAHFPKTKFEVIAICNNCGPPTEIRAFYASHGIQHLTIYQHPGFATVRELQAKVLPTSLLVDTDGRELGRLIGDAQWDSPAAMNLIRHFLRAE